MISAARQPREEPAMGHQVPELDPAWPACSWATGQAMEKQAMLEAQRLVERVAGSDDYKATARQGVEGMLGGVLSGRRLAGLGPVEVTSRRILA